MAIEKAQYDRVERHGRLEIRRYTEQIIAETGPPGPSQ
jgi:hypothetical protein